MIYTKGMKEAEKARLFKEWEWALVEEDREGNRVPLFSTGNLQEDEYLTEQLAVYLENAKDDMVKNGDLLIQEGPLTTSGINIPEYQPTDNVVPKVIFSLVRGTLPKSKAKELVSVQTIDRPEGALIFYINWKYGNNKGGVPKDGVFNATPYDRSWAPQPADRTSGNTFQGYSAYYTSERVGPIRIRVEKVTTNHYQATTPQTADGSGGNTGGTSITAFTVGDYSGSSYPLPFAFIPESEAIKSNTKKTYVYSPNGRRVSGVKLVDSLSGAYSSGSDIELTTGEISSGGPWYVSSEGAAASNDSSHAQALYEAFGGSTSDADGTYYDGVILVSYDMEDTSYIPEMDFEIKSLSISTEEDKVKMRWTQEAKDDYRAYMGLDPEDELVKITTAEMTYNLDRRILSFVMSEVVPEDMYFSYDYQADVLNNTTGNFLDRNQALTQRLNNISALIYERNRRGPANWMVTSPRVASLLAELHGDYLNPYNLTTNSVIGGLENIGQLPSKMKIYVDPNFPVNMCLFGRKGTQSPYDNGVVFSPYTTWMSPIIYDPDNARPNRFVFNRFGINKIPFGELNYAVLTIDNLP